MKRMTKHMSIERYTRKKKTAIDAIINVVEGKFG